MGPKNGLKILLASLSLFLVACGPSQEALDATATRMAAAAFATLTAAAPSSTPTPTHTPTPTPTPTPSPTPTPFPDIDVSPELIVLTAEDLGEGFFPIPAQMLGLNPDALAINDFEFDGFYAFADPDLTIYVGFSAVLTDGEQVEFVDLFNESPAFYGELFAAGLADSLGQNVDLVEVSAPEGVGDTAGAVTGQVNVQGSPGTLTLVTFRRSIVWGLVMTVAPEDSEPALLAQDVADILDKQIVNGLGLPISPRQLTVTIPL